MCLPAALISGFHCLLDFLFRWLSSQFLPEIVFHFPFPKARGDSLAILQELRFIRFFTGVSFLLGVLRQTPFAGTPLPKNTSNERDRAFFTPLSLLSLRLSTASNLNIQSVDLREVLELTLSNPQKCRPSVSEFTLRSLKKPCLSVRTDTG